MVRPTPTALLIEQTSQKAVINWQDFSIGAGHSVRFNQPDTSAIALNRVTGSQMSVLAGQLSANGQVWLLNPHGIVVNRGAEISAQGILMTTRSITDQAFMLERSYSFSDSARPGSAVINLGNIVAANGGYAILAGERVVNEGLVQARLGTVVLAGARTHVMDVVGDRLLSFEVTGEIEAADIQDGGIITHNGALLADGGRILVTARTASDVLNSVINVGGLVQANTVALDNGTLVLGTVDIEGGPSTRVDITGRIAAAGSSDTARGGQIDITAPAIRIASEASLDVSGDARGGNIRVGADWQVQAIEGAPIARKVIVEAGAVLNASANVQGNGGMITVNSDLMVSDGLTTVAGTLLSRGGLLGGNGGRIETSGYTLQLAGIRVDTGAANGEAGLWLLDPFDYLINSTVAGIISTALQTGNVSISTASQTVSGVISATGGTTGAGTITVNSPILKSAGSATTTLTLFADDNVLINAPIGISGVGTGSLNLLAKAGSDIVVRNAGVLSGGGTIALSADSNVDSIGGIAIIDSALISGGGNIRLGGGASGDASGFAGLTRTAITYTTNSGAALLPSASISIVGQSILDAGAGVIELRGRAPGQAVNGTSGTLSNGLIGQAYEGYYADDFNFFTNNTNFRIGENYPQQQATTTVDTPRNIGEFYSLSYKGYFYAPTSGSYQFYTSSDDASHLFLGSAGQTLNALQTSDASPALIVNNGGLHGDQLILSNPVTLQQGQYYPIVVYFGEAGGGDYLQVGFNTPTSTIFTTNGSGFYFNGTPTAPIPGPYHGVQLIGSGTGAPILRSSSGDILINGATQSTEAGSVGIRTTGAVAIQSDSGRIRVEGQHISAQGNSIQIESGLAILRGADNENTIATLATTLPAGLSLKGESFIELLPQLSVQRDLLTVQSSQPISIGEVYANGDIRLLNTSGDITLTGIIESNDGDIRIESAGNFINAVPFINNLQAQAIDVAANRRFLVYSDSPAQDIEGTLDYDFRQYNATPTSIIADTNNGSGFLYRIAPVVTLNDFSGFSKVYDGSAAIDPIAANSLTVSGAMQGDVVGVQASMGSLVFDSANAGLRGVQINEALTVTAINNGRVVYGYLLSTTDTQLTGSISPRQLSAALADGVIRKVYDGNDSVEPGDLSVTLTGLVIGETIGITGLIARYDTKTAAENKTVRADLTSATFVAGEGTQLDNYVLPIGELQSGSGAIDRKALVISGITAANKTYDGNTTATVNVANASFNGIIGSDVVTLSASGVFTDKNAATGKTVNLTSTYAGADVGNYLITDQTSTSADILRKALTVSGITATNKTYDGNTTATVNVANASFDGIIGSDVVTLSASGVFTDKNAAAGKTVNLTSTYAGADVGNYLITDQASTSADILRKALTVSGITAANKTYDGNTAATVNVADASFDGVIGSDVVTLSASGVFTDKNAATGKTVKLTSTYAGADVGNYLITDQTSTSADILRKELVVAGIQAGDKIQDGNRSTVVSLESLELRGLLPGDKVSVSSTGQFSDPEPGSSKLVSLTNVFTGEDIGNYSIKDQTTTTADISQRVTIVVTSPVPAPAPVAAPAPAPAPTPAAAPSPAPAPAAAPAPSEGVKTSGSSAADSSVDAPDAPAAPPPSAPASTAVSSAPVTTVTAPAATTAAPAAASAPTPASPAIVAAAPAPVAASSPAASASTPVVAPPPSPVGDTKPKTPTDSADQGDKTLSSAAPPAPAKPASQAKRTPGISVPVSMGMFNMQPPPPPMPPPPIETVRFSLNGNGGLW